MFRRRDEHDEADGEPTRDENAYETNWYRSLKALSEQHARDNADDAEVSEDEETAEIQTEELPVARIDLEEPAYRTPSLDEFEADLPDVASETPSWDGAALEPALDGQSYPAETVVEEPSYVEPVIEEPSHVEPVAEEPYREEPVIEEPAPAVSEELHMRAGALLERLRRLQHLGDEDQDPGSDVRSSA